MTIKVKNIHDNYSHYYYFYDKFIALIKIFNNHKIYLREAISLDALHLTTISISIYKYLYEP